MLHTLAATFGFAPLVPLWLLALLGLVAVGLCVLALVYRTKGALFRLAAIASVLLWLSGPQRLHESWHMLPQTALLVVDQSPSMALGQRAEIAQKAAQTLTQNTVPGLNLRTVTVR
ncbi:MAG: VWA domain-containing protein, partial [Acetobacter orientalis]